MGAIGVVKKRSQQGMESRAKLDFLMLLILLMRME